MKVFLWFFITNYFNLTPKAMKKSILLSIILSLSLVACIPQAMAQKQSRMEKLLRYLNDNDTEKWQKNREKVDNDTKAYYA